MSGLVAQVGNQATARRQGFLRTWRLLLSSLIKSSCCATSACNDMVLPSRSLSEFSRSRVRRCHSSSRSRCGERVLKTRQGKRTEHRTTLPAWRVPAQASWKIRAAFQAPDAPCPAPVRAVCVQKGKHKTPCVSLQRKPGGWSGRLRFCPCGGRRSSCRADRGCCACSPCGPRACAASAPSPG